MLISSAILTFMTVIRQNKQGTDGKTGESVVAKAFGLNGQSWLRHANPASVWTRYVILALLSAAIWSRVWIGWYCLVPIAILLVWTKINPLFFSKPENFNSWASKSVIGEMMFSNRKSVPVKTHHLPVVSALYTVQFAGVALLTWGLYFLQLWPVLLGLAFVYLGKTWFLDRMVWVFEEMSGDQHYKDMLTKNFPH